MRAGDKTAPAAHDTFFERTPIVEFSAEVVTLATAIRASKGLKTPDALQAARALSLGAACTFITGDTGFACVPGLNVRIISVASGAALPE